MYKYDHGEKVKMTKDEVKAFERDQAGMAARQPDPAERDLNKAEFNYLLNLSGLDDVWDAVAAHLKANDRRAYAEMMRELDRSTFRLDYTLARIKAMEPIIRATRSKVTVESVKAIWADVATGGREA